MASNENVQGLVLKCVTPLNSKELGRGAYGRVYAVKYCETICAAKEIHSILVEGVGEAEKTHIIESFLRECRQCSTLRHPNVIQFIGVYYPTKTGGANAGMRLPVMVMEMMADSLTSFVDKHQKIPVHIKFSIVHGVSLGLCYLHNHDPPIVHRDLSPNNILLTAHHVAKISDLGVAKVIKADSRKTMTKAPGTVDFMPPESLANSPVYGPPMDVFSFGGIMLHTFNQQWPRPSEPTQLDPKTRRVVGLSEIERRQQYLDKMTEEAEVLRPLVEECLEYDPPMRPTIRAVCERIRANKDVYMKEFPQGCIILYQQLEQLSMEKQKEIDQLRATVEQLSPTKSVPIASQLKRATLGEGSTAKLITEAPPLMPALTSDRYHIKWTQLADLPAPLYGSYVAVQHHKIYVAGCNSPVEYAEHQVYVYDVNTDQWGQLPPPGHYFGIPQIIGGKLAIIGGRLSATKKMTNKISTFDEHNQTWSSHYPDMLSARSKPGVVTHLQHVVVAGGGIDDDTDHDDIEVLNWVTNSHWIKSRINLPVPMYGFKSTVSDDHLLIVGYVDAGKPNKSAYKIPVANITASVDQQHNSDTPTRWTEVTAATHWSTALISSSSPPVVVGGDDINGIPTADIKMYDNSKKSWNNIGSLSSARLHVAVAAVYNNAIIVIGGCTKGGSVAIASSSSLTVVELGQVELV